jgi:pyruvate dehydrogenase E2 component (dihydrolipoamide acetyltransferase)
MGLREFASTTKDLAAQCQEGRISPDLLTGATFTVSNLGSFGITSFTPIVNLPQTGILGINAIVPAATIDAVGNLGVERRISFSLTADHQVVDGADAARFLRDLTMAIASVDLFLMA